MHTQIHRRLLQLAALMCITTALGAAGDKADKAASAGAMDVSASPVKPADASKTAAISYYLPRNRFEFKFKLTTTTTRQGQYCDVAKVFFEVPDEFACDKPKPQYSVELGSEVTISEFAKPDTAQAYEVQINKGAFTENNLTLGFGEGNVLNGFQSSIADHKVDFFVSILKTAADVVGHLIHAPAAALAAPARPSPGEKPVPPKSDCPVDLDRSEAARFEELSKTHKAYACGLEPDLRSAYLNLPDRYRTYVDGRILTNHFMNALTLFIEYSELIRSEAQVLRPDRVPSNADGYGSLSKARADRKKEIRAQFLGSEEEATDPVPDIAWDFDITKNKVELFSFDSAIKGGLCFKDGIDGRWFPRATDIPDCKMSDTLVTVYAELNNESADAGTKPSAGAATDTPPAGAGLAYRIPGRAALRVYAMKDKVPYDYFRKSFDIAQFGAVKYLPSKIGNSTSYNVSLDPLTGALKSIVVGVKPPLTGDTAAQFAGLSTSVLGIVDAVKAARKKPSDLDNATDDASLKLEQLKIQLIEACKTDPTQTFCAAILK